MTVPHFINAQTDPPPGLEHRILDALPSIEHWLRDQWPEGTAAEPAIRT